ncbi:MAG: SulP family inorganic anion transporter [Tepidisphaeraceae bacterium]
MRATFLSRSVPGLHTVAGYRRQWLRADMVAGVTLAAYVIPASLGDASLANLAPEAGLYACLFSGMVFWLFCSSRHTSITVTSAISLLVGTSLGELARGDSARFAALAAGVAVLAAAIAFVIWLVKAGVVINFVSETVLVGFKCGIALVLASTQLPKLFGFSGSHGSFWERALHFLRHVRDTNFTSFALGLGALCVLLLGKRFLKNKPVALFVVIAGIVIASSTNLAGHGVKMLGEVPRGLPSIGLPALSLADLNDLLPLAMACFLLGAVETAAIGRMFALKHGYRFDPNQEFLALAASNAAAGLGQGFPVSGGMSQSLVNESGGARTSLSGLVAAVLTLLVVVFFSDLLRNLPQPVLAAIVLAAVTGLVQVDALKHLWRFSHAEFAVSMVALLGVLGSGILRGVLIGAALSLLLLLRRASRLYTTELGRVPGTEVFADRLRHPENQPEPGIFVFRAEGALLYFNVDHVRDRFFDLLSRCDREVRLAVFYLGMVPALDLAGAELLSELHRSLRERDIELRLAEAHGQVREALRRSGFEKIVGPVEANQTLSAVLENWKRTVGAEKR